MKRKSLLTFHVFLLIFAASAMVCLAAVLAQGPYHGEPFRAVTVDYLGTAIARPGHGDMMPTILFDLDEPDPNKRFKMWWLGNYAEGETDLPPAQNRAGDRIYYSHSADGHHWSPPQIVLKGLAGMSGANAADDHLLGSPSVLKINGKYFMFYEAYSLWATTVVRLYSAERGDNWATAGWPQPDTILDWHPSYHHEVERRLGFAPKYAKFGTHPIYSGEVIYRFANGRRKVNRYLSTKPCREGMDADGTQWRWLNGKEAVFWLYDSPAAGRKPLYSCFDPVGSNNFVTDFKGTEPPHVIVELLGYAAEFLDERSPDMKGSLQNRICLATSTDGVHWTRFQGAATGGAVLAPVNEWTNEYPHGCGHLYPDERWDIHRAYGAGYPSALVRDGSLELFYFDDSRLKNGCQWVGEGWRVRIPVSDIENPQAYLNATRQNNALSGSDIKWSPTFQRYFAFDIRLETPHLSPGDPNFRQSAMLVWSNANPDPAFPPSFPPENRFSTMLPTNAGNTTSGRYARWGGIIGDGMGHTLDFSQPIAYTAFHLYYSANVSGVDSVFETDLDHLLVFAYPKLNAVSTNLSVSDASGSQGGSVALSATLKRSSSGEPVEGKPLNFRVNDTLIGSGTTDASGKATVSFQILQSLGTGSKTIVVEFAGDEEFAASAGQGTLTVSPGVTTIPTRLSVTNVRGRIGQTVTLRATLRRASDNRGVSSKRVTFKVNGNSVGAAKTNSTGAVSKSYKIPASLGTGNKTIEAEFAGDSTYGSSRGTGTLTVSR